MNAPARLPITLTDGQQKAYDAFCQFLLDPHEEIFVLEGYAGTGKTTLVSTLLQRIPEIEKSVKLIDPTFRGWDLQFTATTNKACEAFHLLTGHEVRTIHSFLGLRVQKDYKTGASTLVPKSWHDIKEGIVLFIDEGSQLDSDILRSIFKLTKNCKIVFMGDPAQLLQVGAWNAPVFEAGFPTARLTEVVRQGAGNPIVELATLFRETVLTGEFFSFRPDGQHIQHLDHDQWGAAIRKEFTHSKWSFNTSKVLTWTNKAAIAYNHAIRDITQGDPEFQVGDYAVLNKFLPAPKSGYPLKTDELVHITEKGPTEHEHGTPGCYVILNNQRSVFVPQSLEARKTRIKQAKAEEDLGVLRHIDQNWADLRAAYACTINKSQGSTYDTAFIDLNDIKACNSPNQIARMLYVAVSRARHRVVFTGDLI